MRQNTTKAIEKQSSHPESQFMNWPSDWLLENVQMLETLCKPEFGIKGRKMIELTFVSD